MSEEIDISKLDTAEVLAALYNNSKVQGMGFLQKKEGVMSKEEAAELLKEDNYFDYLHGKVMKVRIQSPLKPWGYDRDNGDGAAQRALQPLLDSIPA